MTSRSGVPNQSVDRILLINPGTGYTTPPQVVFTGGSPTSTNAIATAVISEAVLGPIGITTGGLGYTFTPTVGITSVYIQQSNETDTSTHERTGRGSCKFCWYCIPNQIQ